MNRLLTTIAVLLIAGAIPLTPATAGIGWIDTVYNNTDKIWYLRSVDDWHNGFLTPDGGGNTLNLAPKNWVGILPHTEYHVNDGAIPWYFRDEHYKAISRNISGPQSNNGVRFYSSEMDDKNWIVYTDHGKELARQEVPKGNLSDFHCTLRIQDDGIFLKVVNNQFSTDKALADIFEGGKWVAEKWLEMAKAVAVAAVSK
jgi:hypothetical protein